LFASQAYVEEHGVPTCPKDLAHHTGLHLNDGGSESRWKLYRKSREEHPINFKPRICSDDMITLKKAAESGLGIVALPAYLCRTDVRDGRLIRILPEWTARSAMIALLAPSRRGLLPSVRALSNFLLAEFSSAIASDDGLD
jgi:DNA-binding transcriptional LysR family regulator